MRSAWRSLRAYPGRFAAVLLAIVIGVGFATATQMFTASFRTDLTTSIVAAAEKVDVIVYPGEQNLTADDPRLGRLAGLAAQEPIYQAGLEFSTAGARGWVHLETIPNNLALRWFEPISGTWPTGPDAIAVDPSTAERNSLALGSVLTVVDDNGNDRALTVVGIVSVQHSDLAGASDQIFAAPDLAASLTGGRISQLDLTAAGGVSADTLAAAVTAAFGTDASVMTGAAVVAERVDLVLGDADVLGTVLLTFAAIAGLVAAFVIANTFTILLAQRQRQIGLLRCIGASQDQVRRSVLSEALLIGVLGAIGGAVVGAGVALAAMSATDVAVSSFTIDPVDVGITLLIGVVVTVLAAFAPSLRAMRVSPLAALSAVPSAAESHRSGRIRLVVGALLTLAGATGLAGGVILPSLAVAVGGGALSAGGILLLLRSVLPTVVRMIGGLARLGGVSGRLAAANAERNPGRSAATSTALVIAVGLIVTLQVAGASARSSLNASLAERYPLDVSIIATPDWTGDAAVADQPPLPSGLPGQLAGVQGVSTVTLNGTGATTALQGQPTAVTVLGAPEDIASVTRSGSLSSGQVAVPGWMMRSYDIDAGSQLTFTADTGSVTLTVADSRLADTMSMVMVTTAADLARLDPAAAPVAVFGKLADLDDANDVIRDLKPILAPYASIELGGAAADHASIEDGLDKILLLVTALLAVAAVIAVVGIGNTLGLSVVERTRESALLRALGLRRGQLRLMLAVEAALLAAVGVVVGIVVGVGYGWIGAAATFAQADEPLALAFPTGQVLSVLGLALVAGVVASVLPARRAAMAAPTDALAEV